MRANFIFLQARILVFDIFSFQQLCGNFLFIFRSIKSLELWKMKTITGSFVSYWHEIIMKNFKTHCFYFLMSNFSNKTCGEEKWTKIETLFVKNCLGRFICVVVFLILRVISCSYKWCKCIFFKKQRLGKETYMWSKSISWPR